MEMSTMAVLVVICGGAVWFLLRFLVALCQDRPRTGACPVIRIEPEERQYEFEIADPLPSAPAVEEAGTSFRQRASKVARVLVMNRRAAVRSHHCSHRTGLGVGT